MSLLLQIVAFLFISLFTVRVVEGQEQLCLNNSNCTTDDSFLYYLNSLLDSIATTKSSTLYDYGLFNASVCVPQSSDVVEVMGYCRGDQTPDACRSCLHIAAFQIRQMCPRYKQAVLFRDECTLKYSNGSMYGVVSDAQFWCRDCAPATNWDVFKDVLKQLLQDLGSQAASGGLRKYAQDSRPVDLFTLYAVVMCSPDLNDQQCNDCLVSITRYLNLGCVAAYVWSPSCQVTYNNSCFFNPIATPFPSPPPETGNKYSTNVWAVVGLSTALAVFIGLSIFFTLKWIRNQSPEAKPDEHEAVLGSRQYSLEAIMDATNSFSEANMIGRGRFGPLFLGVLQDRQEIAVKRLSKEHTQGQTEFKTEVTLLLRLQHKNLVRLLGFCLEDDERLLVYEFLPDSSLDRLIFGPHPRRILSRDIIHKIITGIARGLLYLHEESGNHIVHCDLKPRNILLDGDMIPKLAGLRTARLFRISQTRADTRIIVGTEGYIAPEYATHGRFSLKSDVYSFGVIVLEIVCGRRNHSEHREDLISRLLRNWGRRPLLSDIDTRGFTRYIRIGLLCVQENPDVRPTMASIVPMLDGHSVIPPVPRQPTS